MATLSNNQKDHPFTVTHSLLNGRFRIRSLTEATELANFLALGCPNPSLAIVGITELIVNGIEHGNLGINSEEKARLQQENNWLTEIERRLQLPEHKEQYVEVEFTRLDSEIHIKVTDQGKGFNWKQQENHEEKNPHSFHGRGLLLAKKLSFTTLQHSEKGNEVVGIISLK